MAKISPKKPHFLTGEEFNADELRELLRLATDMKRARGSIDHHRIAEGKQLALLFEKPSLRTRVSFAVAMNEIGGNAIEILQTSTKKEEPEDTARVLSGYVHVVAARVFAQATLERMSAKSTVPIVNALSDTHHPCQILADLLTLEEKLGRLAGTELAYVGDGNNILHSLLLLAPVLGVRVRYATPEGYEPRALIVKKAKTRAGAAGASIEAFRDPVEAVKGAHAVYTDTWTSMGFEDESAERDAIFEGYQVNEALMAHAASGALVMHCLPMIRGKEISDSLPDSPVSVLFQQSENRLHVQKALLATLLRRWA